MKKQIVLGTLILTVFILAACESSPSSQSTSPNERLLSAARSGDLYGVRAALSAGAYINARSSFGSHYTSLMTAAGDGYLELVKYLVENGAFLYVTDDYGDTALDWAILFGPPSVVEYLSNRMNIDVQTYVPTSSRASSVPSSSYTPSEPAQTSSSSSGQSSGQRAVVEALQQAQEAIRGSLDNGRYRLSGGNEEISFTGIGNTGPLSYTDPGGTRYSGTYSISGDSLTLNIQGIGRFIYTITSRTTFSAPGENWVRVGL
ncbi:MAG: ankyrin repeat domain-containing protein [Treponema sp.]|jgi:hypothetical protein|nr:ankyrin repeat domain-containing protein [Treponema sp.]